MRMAVHARLLIPDNSRMYASFLPCVAVHARLRIAETRACTKFSAMMRDFAYEPTLAHKPTVRSYF